MRNISVQTPNTLILQRTTGNRMASRPGLARPAAEALLVLRPAAPAPAPALAPASFPAATQSQPSMSRKTLELELRPGASRQHSATGPAGAATTPLGSAVPGPVAGPTYVSGLEKAALAQGSRRRGGSGSGGSLGQMRKSKGSSGRRGAGTSSSAADPLTADGVAVGPSTYGGVAKVRADALSAAIDALDSDAAARALAAGVSATAAHLHQIALRLVASVEHPTLSRAESTALLKIVTALLHAGASPKRGLWTALRYYRRYDQWRPIQDFLGKLMRALKRAMPVTSEGTTAWLRSVLQYTPNERWPTTWDLLQTALKAPPASEQHRIAAFVANNVRTDWRRGSESR